MTEYPYPPVAPEPPPTPEPSRRRWLVPVLAATAAVVVVALAVVTTLLVTKSDSAPPAAASATTHTVHPVPVPETHSAPTVADGGLFNRFMVEEGFTAYGTLTDLNALADTVCTGFDSGLTMDDILGILMSNGFSAAMAGRYVGFAVASHCPENSGKVR
jgi:hypothetical protein